MIIPEELRVRIRKRDYKQELLIMTDNRNFWKGCAIVSLAAHLFNYIMYVIVSL